MKILWRRRSAGSLVASIAIHVALIAALGAIVFRYPLGQLMGIPEQKMRPERITYVAIPPKATESSSSRATKTPLKSGAPAALQAPVITPTEVPPPAQLDSQPSQAAGGTGSGFGVSGSGLATGIVPRQPDSRIALTTDVLERTPRTTVQEIDSIVGLAIGIVRDSIAIAAGQRQPGDWTHKGKDGSVWGWDKSGIRLGKFTIPQALLALLPLNGSANLSPIEARSANYIRRDVLENGQRAISEDEFRTAVKRIRERKERERRQAQLASQQPKGSTTP